jgi:Na+/melibiose symporter-like transporter
MLRGGIASRWSRGAFVSFCLIASGLLSAALFLPGLSSIERIGSLTFSGGLALVMYSVGPAMLAEFTPGSQRAGILAIGNGIASLAGLSAPVVTGILVQGAGAEHPAGYGEGFLVCGAVLIIAGVIGLFWMDPQKTRQRLNEVKGIALPRVN